MSQNGRQYLPMTRKYDERQKTNYAELYFSSSCIWKLWLARRVAPSSTHGAIAAFSDKPLISDRAIVDSISTMIAISKL